ncbi:uncharacterized protein [Littorina saxatilis]|uniref:Uncharacterized protein n=1 Tax=Littorina saxatilis TaxID=31220 RepID=A0AAN9BNK0_9CAEN
MEDFSSFLKVVGAIVTVVFIITHGEAAEARAATPKITTHKTTHKTTPVPVTCISCQGIACWKEPVVQICDVTHKLCMSHVTDHSDGTRDVSKGCATTPECQQKYLNSTVHTALCSVVDKQVTGHAMDCFFCCKGSNCNQGPQLIPPKSQLLVG